MTRILLASSPDYDDDHAVGSYINSIVKYAGGELVTLLLAHEGGACTIAKRIVEESVDAGLQWWPWDGGPVDESYCWMQDRVPAPVALPKHTITFSDRVSR